MVLVTNTSVSQMCQSLMKPVKLLISGISFVELLQQLSGKKLILMFLLLLFSYQFFLFPTLQDGINGQPAFVLFSLHCLGLAVLAFWVLAYALHSVSWNPGDHLAKRVQHYFGINHCKDWDAIRAFYHYVGHEWVDCGTSLHEMYLPSCVVCLWIFDLFNYFFQRDFKKLFLAMC